MPHTPQRQNAVAIWLFICAFMVLGAVVLGGITRLTGSGLSIVTWEPFKGIIPPLNLADWQHLFTLYKTSPEYQKINFGITIDEFKFIFSLEFIHRLWARLIGIVFLLPFCFFLITKKISKKETFHYLFLFLLGGLQGLMGWLMVKSGLFDVPHVSHIRLTLHFVLALFLFSLLLWHAFLKIAPHNAHKLPPTLEKPKRMVNALIFLIILTATYGALTAGLKAGLIYNTFPLMNGSLIVEDAFFLTPLWSNFINNPSCVQFMHRLLALMTLGHAIGTFFVLKKNASLKTAGILLLSILLLQVTLGITTLLLTVPLFFATLHQLTAVIALGFSLNVRYQIKLQS